MGHPGRTPHTKRYELVERIAVGGMAEVFRARAFGPLGFEKAVAIKRILPTLARRQEFIDRFVAEARISVSLHHANIVQILDFSRFGESLYIVMEFVDGADLARLLRRSRAVSYAFPLGAALHLATEILSGLDYAHRKEVVHRDVSPSNVLVSRAGEVKIADFGIARATGEAAAGHTRPFQILGKWRYMSPEQTHGARVDARSDLFSAGSVLFEVFTGRHLFTGDDPEKLARAIREGPIRPASSLRPDLPPGVDELLGALLVRDPDRRLASAAEAARRVVEISYGISVPARAAALAESFAELEADAAGESAPGAEGARSISAQVIDDILGSELARDRAGGGDRVTLHDPGPPREEPEQPGGEPRWDVDAPTGTLTFVEAEPGQDGVSRWLLHEGTGSLATLDEAPGRADGAALVAAGGASADVATAPRRRREVALILAGIGGAALALAAVALPAGDEALLDREVAMTAPAVEAKAPPPREEVAALAPADADVAALEHALPDGAPAAVDPGPTAIDRGTGDRLAGSPGPRERAAERPRRGEIDLYVEPWAHVYLGDRKIGTAPRKGLRLPAGRHRLRLVNPVLGRETTIQVEVPARRPYRVTLPGAGSRPQPSPKVGGR